MRWIRHNGRLLAYLLLVVAVVYGLWRTDQALNEHRELSLQNSIEICEQQNRLRREITRALETTLLPPRPVPEEGSIDLQRFVEMSNERSVEVVENFREEVAPLDCPDPTWDR